jgi:hypothetical protein
VLQLHLHVPDVPLHRLQRRKRVALGPGGTNVMIFFKCRRNILRKKLGVFCSNYCYFFVKFAY